MSESLVILQDGTEALAPDSEILEGIKQGKWKVPETDADGNEMTFSVRDAQGAFEVPASYLNNNINDALSDGLNLNTLEQAKQDEEQRRKEIKAEAFDMPTTAAAAGLLRGATLGLSDVAIEKLAGEEALKDLKEQNPNASLAGDIAGTVLPAIVSGGTSLVAKGAQKTAAGAISKLAAEQGSKAAAKIAAKTGLKEGAKRKALELGLTSSIEGALYSGGRSLVDEALLGSEEANYAKVLQDTLTGGLIEGVAGAGLGAGLASTKKLMTSGLTKGKDLVGQPKLWQSVKKMYGKAVEKTKGSDAVSKLFDDKVYKQEQVARYLDDITEADRDMANEIAAFVKEAEDVQSVSRQLREDAIASTDLDKRIVDIPEEKLSKFDKSLSDYNDSINAIRAEPKRYDEGLAMQLEGLTDVLRPDGIETLRDVAINLGETKRAIDTIMGKYRTKRMKGDALEFREQESEKILKDLRKSIDGTLKDYGLFGKAGQKLKQADKIYATTVAPLDAIKKAGNVDTFRELVSEGDVVGLSTTKTFHPEMVAKILRRTGDTKQKLRVEAAQKAITDSLERLSKDISELSDVDTGYVNRIGKIREIVEMTKDIQKIERQTGRNLEGMILGGFIGGSTLGPLGAIAPTALSAVSNPVFMTKTLINMEKRIKGFDNLMKGFKDRFSGKLPKAPKLSSPLIGIHPVIQKITGSENEKQAVEDLQTGAAFEKMDNKIAVVGQIAPKYAETMRRQVEVAKSQVAAVLPPVIESGILGKESKLVMTPSQANQVNQVMLASFAPTEFVKVMADGKATRAGMDALASAHPSLYQQMVKDAAEVAVDPKTPYQKKLKLQSMFGLSVTFEMQDIALVQQVAYGKPQEQVAQRESSKLNAKGVRDIETAQATAPTSAQFS